MQSVDMTINVVRSNSAHGEVYSMQPYVINSVSDLQLFGGFIFGYPVFLRDLYIDVAIYILISTICPFI
jgi:hypothetical protein